MAEERTEISKEQRKAKKNHSMLLQQKLFRIHGDKGYPSLRGI